VKAAADSMFAAGAADTTLDVVHLDTGISTAQLDRDIADRDKFVVAVLHCRIEHAVTAQNRPHTDYHATADPTHLQAVNLLPTMKRSPDRYDTTSAPDFVTLHAR